MCVDRQETDRWIKQFKNDTLNIIKELISDDKRSSLNKHIIYNEDKAFNKSDKSLNINLAINKNKSNYTKLSIEEVNNIEKIKEDYIKNYV